LREILERAVLKLQVGHFEELAVVLERACEARLPHYLTEQVCSGEAGPLGDELAEAESENHRISACRNRGLLLLAAAAAVVLLVCVAAPTRAGADNGPSTQAPAAYEARSGSTGSETATSRVNGGMPLGPSVRPGPVDSGESDQMSRLLLYALGIVLLSFVLPVQIVKAEVGRRRRRPLAPPGLTRPKTLEPWPRSVPSPPSDGPTPAE
jgi:hypothetical protein